MNAYGCMDGWMGVFWRDERVRVYCGWMIRVKRERMLNIKGIKRKSSNY